MRPPPSARPAEADAGQDRNPVIVVPGLTGSRLVDGPSGRVVWGEFTDDYARPDRPEGLGLFALPMREGAPLSELRDEVSPDGLLERLKLRLLGIPLYLRTYFEILRTLVDGGYRDEAFYSGTEYLNCFHFDYDWRRDNAENAQRLGEFIAEKRRYLQAEIEQRSGRPAPEIKFDLVAHSMGALLVRYYLRYGGAPLSDEGPLPTLTWDGARDVERVILIGPPNAGTLESVFQLVDGKDYAPFLPIYPAAVLGTFPAGYQMLPRQQHGMVLLGGAESADLFDPDLWQSLGWGLASPEIEEVLESLLPEEPDPVVRRRIALEHQAKVLHRGRRFTEALDRPATPPDGLSYYLIAGDGRLTPRAVSVDLETGDFVVTSRQPGDGKVLRSSAIIDEPVAGPWPPALGSPIEWDQVLLLSGGHLGLTRSPVFADTLLYWLREEAR